jgi:hypothetical protein
MVDALEAKRVPHLETLQGAEIARGGSGAEVAGPDRAGHGHVRRGDRDEP